MIMSLNPNNRSELALLAEKVRAIAIEGGTFLGKERKSFRRERVEEKSSHDYVSYVDKESEKRLVAELSALLPEAGFIAEEGSGELSTEEYCWVIDPLDGTTNFIHDNAPYCVSIALRDRNEILLGVVYEVCRSECFWTYKGAPSYLNDEEIRVSDIVSINDAFIELGLPYNFNAYKPMANYLIHSLYGKVGGTRIQGAAAAELCYIAAGRFEARIEAFLGPWDIAAGSLILMNAGGKVTDFSNGDSFYSGQEVLASNGKLHQDLLNIIQQFHP
jgi:myo-inositol-1(or 4)-monophosphatase